MSSTGCLAAIQGRGLPTQSEFRIYGYGTTSVSRIEFIYHIWHNVTLDAQVPTGGYPGLRMEGGSPMSRKAQKFRRSDAPEIVISKTDDGLFKIVSGQNFKLPGRRLSGLTRFGYIYRSSHDGRAAFLTPPRGKSWSSCSDQVLTVLRCRGFVQGLSELGFARSLVVHDTVTGRKILIPLSRQPQQPHRRRSQSGKVRARAA